MSTISTNTTIIFTLLCHHWSFGAVVTLDRESTNHAMPAVSEPEPVDPDPR